MLNFLRSSRSAGDAETAMVDDVITGFSIEVTPRTAAKVERFSEILPAGTRVYIAHIHGTSIDEMVVTAARLRSEGFPVMPHFPARSIADRDELGTWLRRYRDEAGVEEALVIAGGLPQPTGAFTSSIELLQTGLFADYRFRRLHVAGHPEGNREIDPVGSNVQANKALLWKQAYRERGTAEMAVVTQFLFEAKPAIEWSERMRELGVSMPIHLGIAGPTKLQTLMKFALACGVGPSLRVLQKRAKDVTKLILPYEPSDLLAELAAHRRTNPASLIEQVHIFPLGGIVSSAEWATRLAGQSARAHA